MLKSKGSISSAHLTNTNPQYFQKTLKDEDSSEDFEISIAEEAIISQKLPNSIIPENASLFAGQGCQTIRKGEDFSDPTQSRSFSHDARPLTSRTPNTQTRESNENFAKNRIPPMSSRNKTANRVHTSPNKQRKDHHFDPVGDFNKENYGLEDSRENSSRSKIPEVSAYTELANKIYMQKFLSNPQGRKTAIGPIGNNDLLLSANNVQKIEEKRNFASQDRQESATNRLLNQKNVIEERHNALASHLLTREMAECTFTPRTTSAHNRRRNLDEFLESQRQHLEKVEMKRIRMQQENVIATQRSREEETYRPEICQKSARMVGRRSLDKTPTHQRLYNLSKKASQDSGVNAEIFINGEPMESFQFSSKLPTRRNTQSTTFLHNTTKQKTYNNNFKFAPEIQKKSKNLKREGRVDTILYNDALRRVQKQNETPQKNTGKPSTPTMSMNSRKAMATRFIKEFDLVITDFIEPHTEPRLNYVQLNDFLKRLYFLKDSEHINHPRFQNERVLLYDLWYILQADKFKGVHRRNLLVFLLGVLNLHFPITRIVKPYNGRGSNTSRSGSDERLRSPNKPSGASPRDRKSLGTFDSDGNYFLSEDDVSSLHRMYEAWYINRLHSTDNLGKMVNERNLQEFSYQPETNKTSNYLANNYREKMLTETANLIQQNKFAIPKDGRMTHIDLLIASKKVSEEKVNKFDEYLKDKEREGCTFKPKTKRYSSQDRNHSTTRYETTEGNFETASKKQNTMPAEPMGNERVYQLYSLAKPAILKRDRDPNEIEFEKNKQEYTFHPVHPVNETPIDDTPVYAKGIEKTIQRLRTAQNEKDQINEKKERGSRIDNLGQFVFALDKNQKNMSKERSKSAQKKDQRPKTPLTTRMNTVASTTKGPNTSRTSNKTPAAKRNSAMKTEPSYTNPSQPTLNTQNYNYEVIEFKNDRSSLIENKNDNSHSHYNSIQYSNEQIEQHKQEESPRKSPEWNHASPRRSLSNAEDKSFDERIPLLFVDVNLGLGQSERITVFEGDTSEALAQKFAEIHGLTPLMKTKLKELLDFQMDGLLSRIDEESNSGYSEKYKHH